MKLIELCVLKLDQDWFPLLDLLAVVLNPMSRYRSRVFFVSNFNDQLAFSLSLILYASGAVVCNNV